MPIRLLVTGSSGQFGQEFCKLQSTRYEIIGMSRKDADISNPKQVKAVINKIRPQIVVHTAAITDVDACEDNPDLAMKVNCAGAENVARAAKEMGVPIVHFSTDYVFDGTKLSAYIESDITCAISHYGKSKLAGENAIKDGNSNWTIIRTSLVYSEHRRNFVKSIITQAVSGKELRVVDDQFSSPTWTKDIVDQTMKIIESNQTGLFHVASKGETSRYEFARLILKILKIDAAVEPVTSEQRPRLAKRPGRSTLKSERLGAFGIDLMRPYNEAIEQFLKLHGAEILEEVKD